MRRQLIRASHLFTGHLALDLNSFIDILYGLCPGHATGPTPQRAAALSRRRPRRQREQRALLTAADPSD